MKTEESNDEFVARLKAVQRRGLPVGFREQLLREVDGNPSAEVSEGPWWMPPRWLGTGLAACWVAIAALGVLTPAAEEKSVAHSSEEKSDVMAFVERQELLASLEFEIEQ